MKLRILYVEDDYLIHMVNIESMQNYQHLYEIHGASNLDEALSLLRSEKKFDIAIIDLRFPGTGQTGATSSRLLTGGLELYPILRRDWAHIRVGFLTGSDYSLLQQSFGTDMPEVFSKPFSLHKAVEALQNDLSHVCPTRRERAHTYAASEFVL